ncbi:MAG TPA: DegT/DnrJ/EryC1/StrS family aminotransferase [Thermoanaerobaculia bacterium]|nr:DegT/DnrJ/EryC1/StrS family aminotransferase [Thermoanaerobaculia bacterium]
MSLPNVPFFRPDIRQEEIDEVVATLESGWLTTGPRVRELEEGFAANLGAEHAIALNSGTAALHLAVEALGLGAGQAVLVPTMTFAATAEVVRYSGATPILVDCDPLTGNIDLEDAERKIAALETGKLPATIPSDLELVGIMPVHVGGLMVDPVAVRKLAAKHDLWIVEDAAHAFPAAWRRGPEDDWRKCGADTAEISCFSFYANKTITTGEGGMAVTSDPELAERMRSMSLHGLSNDAWGRYSKGGSWDYRIVAPGFKYNMTDIAAAIGVHQLERAEEMRAERERIAHRYLDLLGNVPQIELPPVPADRIHSWHLFVIRLYLDRLEIDRNQFIRELNELGIGTSVHWRPLHRHPYYAETFGWREEDLAVASRIWKERISLPLFPTMSAEELETVASRIREVAANYGR